MKRITKAIGLIGIAMLCMAQSSDHPRAYETEYLLTNEIESDFRELRPLQRGDILFKQRMTFAHLAVSSGEVAEAANDEVFVAAGAQFYRAAAAAMPVWCTANMRMPQGALMRDLIGRVYSQYCIVDQDGDGVFHHFFKRARTIETLPNVRGRIPQTMRQIRPIQLTPIDPRSLETHYFVGVSYLRTRGGDNPEPVFQLIAGSQYDSLLVEEPFRVSGGRSGSVSVFGARIELEADAAGTRARFIQGFPLEPLRIRGRNCGMINGC